MMIQFHGVVHCVATTGAVNLVLQGRWRSDETRLLFCAANAPDLPSLWNDARVYELDPLPTGRRFRIESEQLTREFQARSVQVQRNVAAQLYAVVPPPRVPLRVRAAWSLLLRALRLPGVARIILRRGSTT